MALYNMPDGCIWSSDLDYYEWLYPPEREQSEEEDDVVEEYWMEDEPPAVNDSSPDAYAEGEWWLEQESDWTA